MHRSFVSIEPPGDVCSHLIAQRDRLQTRLVGMPIRWVPDANLHLTLRFLGVATDSELEVVAGNLCEVALATPVFQIQTTGGLGAFPNVERPHVLWFGIEDIGGGLSKLQSGIEGAVAPHVGHKEDQLYHPHITLARCKVDGKDAAQLAAELRDEEPPISWRVEAFNLMLSRGRSYHVLHTFQLQS